MRRANIWVCSITVAIAAVPLSPGLIQSPQSVATIAADPVEIITFGRNEPDWNEALGVTTLRLGCSNNPEACLTSALSYAREQSVEKIYLAVLLTERSPKEMAEYSELAMIHSELIQVGIDDFVGAYTRLAEAVSSPSVILETAIAGLKSNRSDLKFGITLYEDQLAREMLHALPVRLRSQIDDVHLYLHYRKGGLRYEAYVDEAKALFPKARIIAGSYAYDRIDYISCGLGAKRLCSVEEEIDLFNLSFTKQLALLQEGQIGGIEFYPGIFSLEQTWSAWNNTAICKADRREQCVENTIRLHRLVRDQMTAFKAAKSRR